MSETPPALSGEAPAMSEFLATRESQTTSTKSKKVAVRPGFRCVFQGRIAGCRRMRFSLAIKNK
jgi:hypothetical protein